MVLNTGSTWVFAGSYMAISGILADYTMVPCGTRNCAPIGFCMVFCRVVSGPKRDSYEF